MYCVYLGRRPEIAYELKKMNYKTIVLVDKSLSPPPMEVCDIFHHVDDISDFDCVDGILKNYFGKYPIHAVISPGERSVLTAARIRQKYGVQGREMDISNKLRDKYLMKEAVSAKGIATAQFALVTSFEEGEEFLSRLLSSGKKVIAKPRMGMGTVDVQLIETVEQWRAYYDYFKSNSSKFHYRVGIILEEYIVGCEFHIDSIIQDNKVSFSCASKYPKNMLDFQKHSLVGSITLPPKDAQTIELLQFNEKVIKSLEIQYGVTHMECFVTADNKIVFGEIAIRPAGCSIPENLKAQNNIDLFEAFAHVECFKPYSFTEKDYPGVSGYIQIPITKPGKVVKLVAEEELLKLEGVYKVQYFMKPGMEVSARKYASERIGVIFAQGKDYNTVYDILIHAMSKSYAHIE